MKIGVEKTCCKTNRERENGSLPGWSSLGGDKLPSIPKFANAESRWIHSLHAASAHSLLELLCAARGLMQTIKAQRVVCVVCFTWFISAGRNEDVVFHVDTCKSRYRLGRFFIRPGRGHLQPRRNLIIKMRVRGTEKSTHAAAAALTEEETRGCH